MRRLAIFFFVILTALLAAHLALELSGRWLGLQQVGLFEQSRLHLALVLYQQAPELSNWLVKPAISSGYLASMASTEFWALRFATRSAAMLIAMGFLGVISGRLLSRSWQKNENTGFGSKRGLVRLGDFELPIKMVTQAILAMGSTGCGKTQMLRHILMAARNRDEGGLILDVGGELFTRLYDPETDCMIGMFDSRSVDWSPLSEINDICDVGRVAASMVHVPASGGVWEEHARIFIEGCLVGLYRRGRGSNRELLYMINRMPMSKLQKCIPKNHSSQSCLQPENERMFASVRATAGKACAVISGLNPSAGFGSWSITNWVRNLEKNPSWLFVPIPAVLDKASKPLASMVASFYVDAVVSLSENVDRRVWFFVDELGQFPPISSLSRALTLGRKYGLACVHAAQSVSQIQSAYGDDGSRTLLSCYGTKMIYRANDVSDAEWSSRFIGDRRRLKTSESRASTNSANGGSYTKSSSEAETIEKIILPAEFQELTDFHAWVRCGASRPRLIKVPFIDLGEQRIPQVMKADWVEPLRKKTGSELRGLTKIADEVPDTRLHLQSTAKFYEHVDARQQADEDTEFTDLLKERP